MAVWRPRSPAAPVMRRTRSEREGMSLEGVKFLVVALEEPKRETLMRDSDILSFFCSCSGACYETLMRIRFMAVRRG